jgi:uncharacterized protein YprB with RNaseH-like and TPR domain
MDATEMLCFVAKWDGEDELIFCGQNTMSQVGMVHRAWELLDEADVVVHYNGKGFDIPHLNREFITVGLTPPSPFKQVDLLMTARKQFRFPSNKLDYVTGALGLGKKVKHIGHDLWTRCMAKDKEAWDMMEEYNRQDVVLLEALYHKLMPWIKGHPQRGLYSLDTEPVCRCGSVKLYKQGFAYTSVSKFQQYSCRDCGSWFRGRKNLADTKHILSNVAG